MAGSGPAGSLNPKRSNARVGVLALPFGGRVGDPPAWPLEHVSFGEAEAWKALWESPQAVAWEHLGWTRVVARYCRVMLIAESTDARVASLAWGEARQLEDRLGLTPKAMRMLLWVVTEDEVGEKRGQQPSSKPAARRRLSAVDSSDS